MTLPVKSCGRKWIHTSHKWEQPAIGVDWENLPRFQCNGISEGITEHEFLAGLPRSERVVVSAEEAASDTLRRYTRQIYKLREFIMDVANQIDAEETRTNVNIGDAMVRVDDIKAILYPED